MGKESDPIVQRLDILTEKLDVLTMVIAVKEHAKKLLEGKTQKEQIQILKKWKFSNEIIALIIGTTPDVVSVRTSEMKTKGQKGKQPKQDEKVSQE